MILCFSGTGNSRYLAKRLAEALQDEKVDLNAKIRAKDHSPMSVKGDVIVVAPTYAWRIPKIVSDWISKTELLSVKRIWFVMDCGKEIGNAAKYNRLLAEQKGLNYMGTAQIIMPENYIAMFDAPKTEKAKKIVEEAEPAITNAIERIRAGQPFPAPRNNLYDRFMSGPVNPIFYRFFCKSQGVSGGECLHRLWAMRKKMLAEQCETQGRKAGVGRKLYSLHGLYLLLSCKSNRVWKEKRRKTTVSL